MEAGEEVIVSAREEASFRFRVGFPSNLTDFPFVWLRPVAACKEVEEYRVFAPINPNNERLHVECMDESVFGASKWNAGEAAL